MVRRLSFLSFFVMGLVTAGASYAQNCTTPPTNGLVGHWELDETVGTTVNDSSPSSNDGTMFGGLNGTNDSITGLITTALNLDGSDDYIGGLGNYSENDVTVSGWFRADSLPQNIGIFSKFLNTSDGWTVEIDGSNIRLRDDVDNADDYLYATSISADQWYHLAAVMESLENKLYLNGVLIGSGNNSTADWSSYGGEFFIGTRGFNGIGSPTYFNGDIDDVRIYDRALSGEEIAALYEYGFGDEGNMIFDQRHASLKYCDGIDWVHAGVGSYNPNAVEFASPDNLSHNSVFTGAPNTNKVTGSFWYYPVIDKDGTGAETILSMADGTAGQSRFHQTLKNEIHSAAWPARTFLILFYRLYRKI